jgi:hypothetical protein
MARRTVTSYRAGKVTQVEDETGTAQVAVVEKPGMSMADGIAIATTLLLLAALVMTDYYLGKRYGKGIFF